MGGRVAFVVALLLALPAAAQSPAKASLRQGRHCSAVAPPDWSFKGENPAGNAFGADIVRADGQAIASYFIVGVPAELRASPQYARWYATPHAAVMATLTQFGTVDVRCAAPRAPAPGLALMQCRTPRLAGLALYQVFPMAANGYVLVVRTAATAAAAWPREGALASAVARSVRCSVPLRPSSFDYTSGPSDAGKRRRAKAEGDPEYSRWLGMEHAHDPATGQNYWVESGRDWRENGPRGPGFYANVNGEQRLLSPGRSD